jgi:hypothetical protein
MASADLNSRILSTFSDFGLCLCKRTANTQRCLPLRTFYILSIDCLLLRQNNKGRIYFHFHFEMDGISRLMELWEAGIPPFSVKNAMPGAEKCLAKTKPRASSREVPIRLADLMGAFFILGIGLSLALFAFLVEIIFKRLQISMQENCPKAKQSIENC